MHFDIDETLFSSFMTLLDLMLGPILANINLTHGDLSTPLNIANPNTI
jgi:hypothetical protein